MAGLLVSISFTSSSMKAGESCTALVLLLWRWGASAGDWAAAVATNRLSIEQTKIFIFNDRKNAGTETYNRKARPVRAHYRRERREIRSGTSSPVGRLGLLATGAQKIQNRQNAPPLAKKAPPTEAAAARKEDVTQYALRKDEMRAKLELSRRQA